MNLWVRNYFHCPSGKPRLLEKSNGVICWRSRGEQMVFRPSSFCVQDPHLSHAENNLWVSAVNSTMEVYTETFFQFFFLTIISPQPHCFWKNWITPLPEVPSSSMDIFQAKSSQVHCQDLSPSGWRDPYLCSSNEAEGLTGLGYKITKLMLH